MQHLPIPADLFPIILDMAYDTPVNNYKNVMKELKKIFCHPTCGESCFYKVKFIDGSFIRRPMFWTQCKKLCIICNSKVGKDYHTKCHACAEEGSIEFSYHHNRCHQELMYG